MYFMILCFDKTGMGELREVNRHADLAYLKEHAGMLRMGGPLETDEGNIIGTLFLINVEDRDAAQTFTDNEPFHKAGVFEAVLVRRWRQSSPRSNPERTPAPTMRQR